MKRIITFSGILILFIFFGVPSRAQFMRVQSSDTLYKQLYSNSRVLGDLVGDSSQTHVFLIKRISPIDSIGEYGTVQITSERLEDGIYKYKESSFHTSVNFFVIDQGILTFPSGSDLENVVFFFREYCLEKNSSKHDAYKCFDLLWQEARLNIANW